MSGLNEKGGAVTPPATARLQALDRLGHYHPPADPRKAFRFSTGGRIVVLHGKRAGLLLALIAAGDDGVRHVEVMPWLFDIAAAVGALKGRGLTIETQRGRPTRWILRSRVELLS